MIQFNSISSSSPSVAQEANVQKEAQENSLAESSKNLLKHIPGEASGFYLIAAGAFEEPGVIALGVLFSLSMIILVLVRKIANASKWIYATTVGAFIIWMFVIDGGFLAELVKIKFPMFEVGPWGLIVAMFYSIVVTLAANAGKIR